MDQLVDQWDLVIKVKYGDTLRRISAYVHGQLMDQNMSKLRAKIVDLFKFDVSADFILTYTDEDGDIVTLDDDDELRDAVIGQRLNPLRINVQLKPKTGSPDARPEKLSLDMSPQPENPQTAVDGSSKSSPDQLIDVVANLVSVAQKAASSSPGFAQFAEASKLEPFKSVVANLSKDILTATSSSSPACGQLVEYFSKLGLSNASQTSVPTNGSNGSSNLVDPNTTERPNVSNSKIQTATESLNNKNIPVSLDSKQNVSGNPGGADINSDTPRSATSSEVLIASVLKNKLLDLSEPEKEVGSSRREGKSAATMEINFPTASQPLHNAETFWTPEQQALLFGDMRGSINNKQSPTNVQAPSSSKSGFEFQFEVQGGRQLGAPMPNVFGPPWSCPVMHPYQRSQSYNENTQRAFHRGVQCDGCGMHPIVGPRFKSNVKEDYDLCSVCFTQMGNEAEYTRIERSAHRGPRLLKGFHNHHLRHGFPHPNVLRCGLKVPRAKLESRFIKDVTVLDGTVMPPSTCFTKIWRMRNNGAVVWPFGTHLLWVGGDQFGDRVSTDLEIPADGFPAGKELDIAVDFTAPSGPGRYVSYWRMASPSGQKFGQRVWVLIQVDCSRPNTAAGNSFSPGLNLNLPPESCHQNELVMVDVNVEPFDSGFPEINTTSTTEELMEPVVVDVELIEQPVGDLLDAGNDGLPKSTPVVVTCEPVSYPLIDLPAIIGDESPVGGDAAEDNPVEQKLLKELEEMGFMQIDLNKEILRQNEYDLEQSVDDLCGFSEWDPLLSELHEMGFYDKELNKKLLIKNNGSIKRAVLDLIAGEKFE